jgi:hypothetical protein
MSLDNLKGALIDPKPIFLDGVGFISNDIT